MSIKRKIFLSFIISASIIASLIGFEFYNYVEMRNEIAYLELTDTIRSKSLQLRRHEKNFFLYSPQMSEEETAAVQGYIEQMRGIIDDNLQHDKSGRLRSMDASLEGYSARFEKIRENITNLNALLDITVPADPETRKYYPLIELTFVERPKDSAAFLETAFGLPAEDPLVAGLLEMDSDITELRKSGESIMTISKELDKEARANVDRSIALAQKAILVFFPLFLVFGGLTLFLIAGDVAMRLADLTRFVETTGRGEFVQTHAVLRLPGKKDEIGLLADKFNEMGDQLAQREQELIKKNEELLETKKLAAIGTLAAGVAHELNNPLNNIYVSAQVLKRKAGADMSPVMREVVDDIVGQTARVKRIVGDLLEFARMKEPEPREVDICGMIDRAFGLAMSASRYAAEDIRYTLKCDRAELLLDVDPDRMDRVFINIITNALDAMQGKGELAVAVEESGGKVDIAISDTGGGIEPGMLDKIFEPFHTTKDRGTGLGLSIAYNIIKKHGGEISVESEIGSGTTFTIRLPRQRWSDGV